MMLNCQLLADLVGTTLADDGAVEKAMREAVTAAGLRWDAAGFAGVRGRNKKDAIRTLLETQGRPAAEAEAIHDAFSEALVRHYARAPLGWAPGADAAFRKLHAGGVRLVLATGFPAPIRDAIAPRVPWRDSLSAFLSGDDVARGRPAPDLVQEAMRRTGVREARQVAVVGDTAADVQCGRAAGAGLVIAVTAGTTSRRDLEALHPDALIESVAELPAVLGLKTK